MSDQRPDCYSRTRNAMMAPDQDDFDGAREPLRAIRDLISACEGIFGDDNGEQGILGRAQAGFTTLRALWGDFRPAEEIASAAMKEPDAKIISAAIQLKTGA